MTQEVEVTITLEVDVRHTKEFIQDRLINLFGIHSSYLDLIKIKSIKEEAELYGNE